MPSSASRRASSIEEATYVERITAWSSPTANGLPSKLGPDLCVEFHSLPDPESGRLPVARLKSKFGRGCNGPVCGDGHPHRRVRLLVGSRRHPKLRYTIPYLPGGIRRIFRVREDGVFDGEGIVAPVVRKVLVRPNLPHYLHRFRKQFPVFLVLARIGVAMKLWTFVWPDPPAEADLQAALGHVVQGRKIFGKSNRMPPRSYVRHLSDANPGCSRREVSPEQNRVRKIAHSIGPKMVLPEPHCLEAEFLGENCLMSEVVNVFLCACSLSGRPRHGSECCELHAWNLPLSGSSALFR